MKQDVEQRIFSLVRQFEMPYTNAILETNERIFDEIVNMGTPALPAIFRILNGFIFTNSRGELSYLVRAVERMGTTRDISKYAPFLIHALANAQISTLVEGTLVAMGKKFPKTVLPELWKYMNKFAASVPLELWADRNGQINQIIVKIGEPGVPYLLDARTDVRNSLNGRFVPELGGIDPIFSKIILNDFITEKGLRCGIDVGREWIKKREKQYLLALRRNEQETRQFYGGSPIPSFVGKMAIFYYELGERTGEPAPEFTKAINDERLRSALINVLLSHFRPDIHGTSFMRIFLKKETEAILVEGLGNNDKNTAARVEKYLLTEHLQQPRVEIGLQELLQRQRRILWIAKTRVPHETYERLEAGFAESYIRNARQIRDGKPDAHPADCELTEMAKKRMGQRERNGQPKMFRQLGRAIA